eukprot:COSAG02_NODE_23616_length_713_cov_0.926710_1_plen_111_part_10
MEVLKLGKEKRAQRFCKKRLGTHQRGVAVRIHPAIPRARTRAASVNTESFGSASQTHWADACSALSRLPVFSSVHVAHMLFACVCVRAEEGSARRSHPKDAAIVALRGLK